MVVGMLLGAPGYFVTSGTGSSFLPSSSWTRFFKGEMNYACSMVACRTSAGQLCMRARFTEQQHAFAGCLSSTRDPL
jgi:hypothetical protein